MPANLTGTSFWTAVFGLIAAFLTLVATVGGLLATFQGGTSAGGNSDESSAPAASATATAVVVTAPPTPISAPSATPTPAPSPVVEVWSEGTLEIPISSELSREVADLDSGRLVRSDASEAATDSDLSVTETDDGILIEPGVRGTEGDNFAARFVLLGVMDGDMDGCAASIGPSAANQQLLLFSDTDVGDHVCMVTTDGRLAEFEIIDAKLTGRQRWLEIRYTTWAGR